MKNEHIRIDWHSCLAVFVVCDETLQTLSLLFYSGKCWPVLFTDCIQPTLLGVVLTQLVIKVVDLFGSFANVTEEFSKYSLIVIHSANEQMSLYVDYECSGVIETAAYLGLLTFYPLYNRQEKCFMPFWNAVDFASNVIRLLFVVAFVHFGGSDAYFLAHSILGRLFFYGLVITLYYHTFTYSQVARSLYEKKNRLFRRGSTDGLLIQFNLDADGVLDYLAVDSFTRRDHPGIYSTCYLFVKNFQKKQLDIPEKLPFISVIVPVYNSAETLYACIRSINESTYPNENIQILLADNGSTDESFAVFNEAHNHFNQLNMHWIRTEQGKAQALNSAIYDSIGTYIINIDSDGFLEPTALMNMVLKFENDYSISAMSGTVLTQKKQSKDQITYGSLAAKSEYIEYAQSFWLDGMSKR